MPPGQCSDAGALTLTAEETTTPELECLGVASQEPPASGGGGRGCEQEAQGAQALFPIFRPRNQRKCILLVRHGESSEWAAPCVGPGVLRPGCPTAAWPCTPASAAPPCFLRLR